MQDYFDTNCRGTTKCELDFDAEQLVSKECEIEIIKRAFKSKYPQFANNYDPYVNEKELGIDFSTVTKEYDPTIPEPIFYTIA